MVGMFREIVRIALLSLLENRFRTLLTILSVTIGAFSIVVMTSLAESGSKTLIRSVEEIGGARLVWWVPSPPRDIRQRTIYSKGLILEDLQALKDLPHLDRITSFANFDKNTVYVTADKTLQPDVVGLQDGLLEGLNWRIRAGRKFNAEDVAEQGRVCILTEGVEQKLFPEGSSLGRYVVVFGQPYQVVGVLEKRKLLGNVQIGFDWDFTVFIPSVTAEKREGKSLAGLLLIAFTKAPEHNKTVLDMGNNILLARHRGVEDFKVINFGDMLSGFFDFFRAVNLIVAVIAGISLFAGGIGVMNIMLVSVTERTREIGIRRSLGATRIHILAQFVGEAMVLSSLGGILGISVGTVVVGIAHLGLQQWSEYWTGTWSMMGLGMALASTAAIGVFFGAMPAWQASRLDIVECLRR